jgi:hypothetical protein
VYFDYFHCFEYLLVVAICKIFILVHWVPHSDSVPIPVIAWMASVTLPVQVFYIVKTEFAVSAATFLQAILFCSVLNAGTDKSKYKIKKRFRFSVLIYQDLSSIFLQLSWITKYVQCKVTKKNSIEELYFFANSRLQGPVSFSNDY